MLTLFSIAIIGIIILWGLVHAAGLSSPWLSSLFSKPAPKILVTAPESATPGIPFTISWKYDTTAKGYYAFLYSCQKGLQFKTAAAGGTGVIAIPCGAAFSIASQNNTMSLTPALNGTVAEKASLSIVFIPSSATDKRVQGSASVTVTPISTDTSKPVVDTTPAPAPTPAKENPKPLPVTPKVTGPADLSVRIITASIDGYGNGVVSFDIANVGGSSTGVWNFTAQLPTRTGYTYNSPAQTSLAPGDHIVNTLNFTQGVGGVASIQVDPYNAIREATEGNNYASQAIGMTGYYNTNPYGY